MRRWVPAIAALVVVADAVLLATGVIGRAAALALFLAVEVPLAAVVVAEYVRRYRHARRAAPTRRAALSALAADDPYLRLASTEARTLASLARWVARRPDVPAGATAIGYARGTLGVPAALSVAAAIEVVAVHLLVPWPVTRIVLDVLGLYGLVVILGMLAGRVVRPHLLTGDTLVLRNGPHVCARVPLDAVAAVRRDRRLSPTAAEFVEDPGPGGAGAAPVLALAGPDGTGLTLDLDRPVPATAPTFPWRRPNPRDVREVRLHVDDPGTAARALTQAPDLGRPTRPV
ncbi:hypothetical protein [Dietzia sp. 179-F 9C3 NHS]|uniref:hypothetical protein n=1 Tax=Dietzia sp. 179-F 9C3 NHS TaxID=3374295 RepID=UPI00387A03B1